jgi:hypothetical protein
VNSSGRQASLLAACLASMCVLGWQPSPHLIIIDAVVLPPLTPPYTHAGIGKTTAVVNVPSMLLPHLQRAHDTPETWGKYAAMGGDELYTRLQSWCTPRGPLVFHIDFNAYYGTFECLESPEPGCAPRQTPQVRPLA